MRQSSRSWSSFGALLLVTATLMGFLFVEPTARAISPGVRLLSPNGGEVLTGGVDHPLVFELNRTDELNSIQWARLYYRNTSADPWSLIFTLLGPTIGEGWNNEPFPLPAYDSTTAELRLDISVSGEGVYSDAIDAPFTVDSTAPVLSWVKTGPSTTVWCPYCAGTGSNLTFRPAEVDVTFAFSEPVDQASVESITSIEFEVRNESDFRQIVSSFGVNSTELFFSWDPSGLSMRVVYPEVVPHSTVVIVHVPTFPGFRDLSVPGNRGTTAYNACFDEIFSLFMMCIEMAGGYATEPSNDPPAVAVSQPAGGEVWSGGTNVTLAFDVADDRENPFLDEPVFVFVNYTPAVVNPTIFSGYLPDGSYTIPWTTPGFTFPAYQVSVTAVDNGSLVTGNPLATTMPTPAFGVDATAPYVLASSTPNLAVDVPLDAPIDITFSEAMDEAAVEAAFWITPDAAPTFTWTGTTVHVGHAPFFPLTDYTWGFDCSLTDLSVPGNPLQPCAPSRFTTANTPPLAAFDAEPPFDWSGGKSVAVSWTMQDENTSADRLDVSLEMSIDGGGWVPVASGLGLLTAEVPVPCTEGGLLDLRLSVLDEQGMSSTDTILAKRIDCLAPFVTLHSPADGAIDIDPTANLVVQFSEAVDPATLATCFRLLPNPGALNVTWFWAQRTAYVAHPPLLEGVTYTVAVCAEVRDYSYPGLELGGYQFNFTTLPAPNTPPSVAVSLAAPGNPSPGAVVDLSWTGTDAEDPRLATLLEFSVGAGPFTAIASGSYLNGPNSLPWSLPEIDGSVTVRACVTDSRGAEACDLATLDVDGTRPDVTMSPAEGSVGIPPDQTLLFSFSEPMRETGIWLTLEPAVGGLDGQWLDAQTYEVRHDPFALGVTYTVRLGCGLRDQAEPGNLLAGCPVRSTFTIEPPDLGPSVAFLEPLPGATFLDPSAILVRWTAVDDRDATLGYAVRWIAATGPVEIASGTMATEASATWTVPPDLLGPVTLEACATDSAGGTGCTATTLTIARTPEPPGPLSQGTLEDDTVDGTEGLVIGFPGTLDPAALGRVTVSGGAGLGYSWTFANNQSFLTIDAGGLAPCQDYTLTLIDAEDLAVWQRSFSTLCGPSVSVDVPEAGGILRGGAIVLVTWDARDEDSDSLEVFLNYSLYGGGDGFPAQILRETLSTGVNSLSWRVPAVDSLNLVLRVFARDAEGHPAWNVTRTLRVDSTPPVPNLYRDGGLETGSAVRFDGSASYDAFSSIARYRWRVWTRSHGLLAQGADPEITYTFDQEGEHLVTLEVWDLAGNVAATTQRVLIGPPGGAGGGITVVTVATGSLLGLAALGAAATATSERFRNWGYRTFFLPLYVRLKPDAITDQAKRWLIIGYLRGNPGDSFSSIKRTLGVGTGTLTWHLEILEREHIIHSQSRGSKRHYYPADVPMPENGGGLHELQLRIQKVVREQPGLKMSEIGDILGVGTELVHYHVRGLNMKGLVLVRREKLELAMRVYPRSVSDGPRLSGDAPAPAGPATPQTRVAAPSSQAGRGMDLSQDEPAEGVRPGNRKGGAGAWR